MDTIRSGIFLIDPETLLEVDELLDRGVKRDLVLHNDDFHTFEYVIETLVELCDHTLEQAEQCTYLVHYKGKCVVKLGTIEELKPVYRAIQDRGLTVEIQ